MSKKATKLTNLMARDPNAIERSQARVSEVLPQRGLAMPQPARTTGHARAIERSEARGQQELVASEVLPTRGLAMPGPERATWEAMGILIGDPVKGDDLFTHVTLPVGWSKRATDHSMWSDLIDDRGRVRAKIFFKAAFYDRSARIMPCVRFSIEHDYEAEDVLSIRVLDYGTVRYAAPVVSVKGASCETRDKIEQTARDQCKAWLIDNGYPDFGNAAAYWD